MKIKYKHLFWILPIIILVICIAVYALNSGVNVDKISKACVSIYTGLDIESGIQTDDTAVGSGFFCADSTIITAYHNIVNSEGVPLERCHILTSDGGLNNASVIYCDPDFDIAVLYTKSDLPKHFYNVLKIDTSEPKINDKVYSVCTPKTLYLRGTLLQGNITNTKVNGLANQYLLLTDLPLSPGCSGSPIINSNNQVIGMNAFKSTEFGTEGLSFAIYANKLREALENANKILRKENDPQIHYGIDFEENYYSQKGIFNQAGITVKSISENSVFYGSELEFNALVMSIDGVDVYTSADFYELWKPGSVIKIVLDNGDGGWKDIVVK